MVTRRGTKHHTEIKDNSALWDMMLPIELVSLWFHRKLTGVDKIPNQLFSMSKMKITYPPYRFEELNVLLYGKC